MSDEERTELIQHYAGGTPTPAFLRTFLLCGMQRLMQALGAYGFLGLVKGHKHFLEHIPRARQLLGQVVGKIDGLQSFKNLLVQLG